MYVDPTAGNETAIGAYKLTVCLPSPNIPVAQGGATFGAKLILAQLNLQSGVFTTPANRGTFRWHVLATPWPATAAGPPNVAGTVEAQGRVQLPARINNLRATSRFGRMIVRGSVLEGSQGVAQRQVRVRVGNRTFLARTNTGGAFTVTLRRRVGQRLTINATATIPERAIPCSSPSPFPGVDLRERDAPGVRRDRDDPPPGQVAPLYGRGRHTAPPSLYDPGRERSRPCRHV